MEIGLRRAGLAGALGTGLALVGVALSGIAGLDGDLRRAEAERPPGLEQRLDSVSVPARWDDCPWPERGRPPRPPV